MATELISSKLVAPFYGTSIYVWAAIFSVTLIGLALGYYYGGKFSEEKASIAFFRKMLLLCTFFVLIMPFWSKFILGVTSDIFSLELGIIVSVLLFLFPPLFLFGMVSPFVIQFLSSTEKKGFGRVAGKVYAISTIGGVLATFSFGFYFIPFSGVFMSSIYVFFMVLFGLLLTYIIKPKHA